MQNKAITDRRLRPRFAIAVTKYTIDSNVKRREYSGHL